MIYNYMATPFYENFLTENIPYVIRSITERLLLYYANSLYKPLSVEEALQRFVLSNTNDDGVMIKRAIDKFKNSQGIFPFTAYNIDTVELQDSGFSHYQKNGSYYSTLYDCYLIAVPIIINFGFVTFFTTAHDFWKAYTILQEDNININSLEIPITINEKLTSFQILFDNVAEKGDLAFDIEQYFQYGKLYPLSHTTTVNSIFYLIDYNIESHDKKIIYHVDDIILKLHELEQQNTTKELIHCDESLQVTESNPAHNDINVPTNLNTITIQFNIPCDNTTFNYTIAPTVSHTLSWSDNLKTVTITLNEALQPETMYIITIINNTQSIYGTYPQEDITISFTTKPL